jgi:hypothetical protein
VTEHSGASRSATRVPPRPSRALQRRALKLQRRRRVRRVIALLVVLALVPVAYSYVTTMLQPSSLPLGIRSIEWVRANGGAGLVNSAERVYYRWTAPKPGGPGLASLPRVGGAVPAAAGGGTAPRRAARAFRPQRVRPVILPALAGEGAWRPAGTSVAGRPAVFVTAFRPEAAYPRTVAYAAWIDHKTTQLALYPGRYEPPSASPRGPMEVPYSQRWRLLATFNSGFTYKDGHGGFALDGRVYEPLQPGYGTLVGYRSGRVDVVAWNDALARNRQIVFARQNLRLLVDAGRPNPVIADGSLWGSTLGNAVRVWRSGAGIDARGNLVYVAADYQTAQSLASALIRVGAVRAIELDINAEWPSFIAYGGRGGRGATKIVPNDQQPASRYLVPDDRDFFAILRRIPGHSAIVPLR